MRSGCTAPRPATTSTCTSTMCRSTTSRTGTPAPRLHRGAGWSDGSETEGQPRHRAVHAQVAADPALLRERAFVDPVLRARGAAVIIRELEPEPVIAHVHAHARADHVFHEQPAAFEMPVLIEEVAPAGVQVLRLQAHLPAVGRGPGQAGVQARRETVLLPAHGFKLAVDQVGALRASAEVGLQLGPGHAQAKAPLQSVVADEAVFVVD